MSTGGPEELRSGPACRPAGGRRGLKSLHGRALDGLAGTAVVVLDDELRIRLVSGGLVAERELDPARLQGRSLTELLGPDCDLGRVERACRQALAGGDRLLDCTRPGEPPCSLRVTPLEGGVDGGPAVLLLLTEEGPVARELDQLRQRAADLEASAEVARALARSTYAEEARATVCEAAAKIAGADLALLFEPDPAEAALVVSAAFGAEPEPGGVPLDGSAPESLAFDSGELQVALDLDRTGDGDGSPLPGLGVVAAIWQPVRRSVGVRGVVAVGWRRPIGAPGRRLLASLALLADEAAVAIDRGAALERLTGLARTDPLTDLSNRRAWQDEVAREIARASRFGQRLCIGVIDLDELKAFNDRWGHAAGDRLLLTAAARWRRGLRMTDLLARVGGDEFAVALPGCGLGEATRLAEELRGALPEGLSCSIGVTEWARGEDPGSVLRRADEALYEAKRAGRDRTIPRPPPEPTGAGRQLP